MASTTDWGLTDRGFRRPSYAELLDAVEIKARELFGSQANLTVRSPLGIFLRIQAWMMSLLFATLESVYNSRFVDTAVGTSLYNIGRSIGLSLLPAQKATGYLEITGTPDMIIPKGWLASNAQNVMYVVLANTPIKSDGKAVAPAQAVLSGPDGNTKAGTITTIVNPGIPPGIESVTNPVAFEGGSDHETDEEYRDRYYRSVDFAGGVNSDAIRAEILQTVEGIHSVTVEENDTDYTNDKGLPPHSIEAIAYGGLNEAVAAAIARRKAAGIQTYGNTSANVIMESGKTVSIKFSRPTLINIWVRISGLVTDPNTFPVDGATLIRQAIIEHIGGTGISGLDIGETVYQNRIPCVVRGIDGVIDFRVELSTNGTTYTTNNVVIGIRQKAITSESRVTVS